MGNGLNKEELRIALAKYSHDVQWAGWMKYMFGLCESIVIDGKVVMIIPTTLVDRWKRQMDTPFDKLSKQEQKSDYAEANNVMSLPEMKELLNRVIE